MRTLVVLFASAALASVPAADAQAAKPCKPRPRHHNVQTLASNDQVRVYKLVDLDEDGELEDSGEVYACDRRTGWRKNLGLDGNYVDDYEVRPVLSGRLLAYAVNCTYCRDNYQFAGRVSVLDVSTHHHTFAYRNADRYAVVTDHVLKPNGSVAWISAGYVRKHDAGGTADLDSGRKIDPESLTLDSGSMLHWLHGGDPRSAPLE